MGTRGGMVPFLVVCFLGQSILCGATVANPQEKVWVVEGQRNVRLLCKSEVKIGECSFKTPYGRIYSNLSDGVYAEQRRLRHISEQEGMDCGINIRQIYRKDIGDWECYMSRRMNGQPQLKRGKVVVALAQPHVDKAQSGNKTAFVGDTVLLNCRAKYIGNKTVSWIRHPDFHLLTVGRYTYTSDIRFRAMDNTRSEDYILKIRSVEKKDTGIYECQISTSPVISHFVFLDVTDPQPTTTTYEQYPDYSTPPEDPLIQDQFLGELDDNSMDECPFSQQQPLYSEVSQAVTSVLHPDYSFLQDQFMDLLTRLNRYDGNQYMQYITTSARYKDVKANLEVNPITIFANLTVSIRDSQRDGRADPKLGEFLGVVIMEKYSQMESIMAGQKINDIVPFEYDKSKWTVPWIKQEIIRGFVYIVKFSKLIRSTAKAQALIETNNIDNVIQVIGELANEEIQEEFNDHKDRIKAKILRTVGRITTIDLLEEYINKTVDCWYETDGFYHIEEGAEENLLLLQSMIEVVPKNTVKQVFSSLRNLLENVSEVDLDEIINLVNEKLQEFDASRMLNLFKIRMENVIQEIQARQVGGENLFQRVQKLNRMVEKAMWRIRSGLWPEMVNFLDRLVLSLKTKELTENVLTVWKDLDNLLSTTYHKMKTDYHSALIKGFFPTSSKGAGSGDLWPYSYVSTFMQDLKGRVNLSNLLTTPLHDTMSQIMKKINVMESEKWLEEHLYQFICRLIETVHSDKDNAHPTLKDVLAPMASYYGLFMEDWEDPPRELEAFLKLDWQAHFVYILHVIGEQWGHDLMKWIT